MPVTDKERMPREIATPRTVVRRACDADLADIAAWPAYPWPFEVFNMTGPLSPSADGRRWWQRIGEPDRCHYSVVLPQSGEVIGVHAFTRVDWAARAVGNMGIRIRPDLCGRGYGTETLGPLLAAVLRSGMSSVRLDVAAPNGRAVRCYEKCGMRIVDGFWQEHTAGPIDLADPKWSFAVPHLRREGDRWLVRFYWLAITGDGSV